MSMNIPSQPKSGREFTLNATNEIHNAPEHDVRALVAPSLNSFRHEDEDFADKHADKMAGLGLASGVLVSGVQMAGSSMGAANIIGGVLVGIMAGGGVAVTGIFGMIIAGAIVRSCSASQTEDELDRKPELPLMPANSAKLDERVFQEALESGILPDKFRDPVMKETIETPVAFSNDSTGTIYDLETVKNLRKHKITRNPTGGSEPLDFNKLVYLPEVKKQIDEIKKRHPEET